MREAELNKVVDEYRSRIGEMLSGLVKITRDNIIVDLGNNTEALLPKSELMPREVFECLREFVLYFLILIRKDEVHSYY